ncbi:MAG: hypothetical protein ABIE36_02015 [Candidatus Diapherotrites archaeon]
MRIGIIGSTKLDSLKRVNKDAVNIIKGLSRIVAKSGNEIVITPDKGSVSEFFAREYLDYGGKKVYCIIPLDDKEFGYSWLNLNLGENINCGIWRNQPEKLNEETNMLLGLGYAEGVLIEIAYSKWFKPKPVKIIKELVSGELPWDSTRKINLEYVSYKKFKV